MASAGKAHDCRDPENETMLHIAQQSGHSLRTFLQHYRGYPARLQPEPLARYERVSKL